MPRVDPASREQWQGTEIRSGAACRVADLSSILDDLIRVVRRCDLILSASFETEVNDALWEPAVVAYGHFFTAGRDAFGQAGKRRQISHADLVILTPAELAAHQALRVERNRQIGHRDDPFGEVPLVIRAVHDSTGVNALAVTLTRRGITDERVSETKALATRLFDHLQATHSTEMCDLKNTHETI